MPERALLRLRRAGVALYDIQKPQKDEIRFLIKEKDLEKLLSVYPKMAEQNNGRTAYSVRVLSPTGATRKLRWWKNRIGFALGAILFCALTTYADGLVFGVDFVGSEVYAREARMALAEYGIKPRSVYKRGNEDGICARLLTLPDVEFCSVQKRGHRVVVEMRLNETPIATVKKGALRAKHTGIITSITTLRGNAIKVVGERVSAGETLVEDVLIYGEGERKKVDVIARASIACEYVGEFIADDERGAFAQAYLESGITPQEKIEETDVQRTGETFCVRIAYTAIERMNF